MSQFGFFSPWEIIFTVMVVFVGAFRGGRRLFRGKILTMPIRRLVPILRPRGYAWADKRGFRFRLVQIACVDMLLWFSESVIANLITWILVIGFYIDDYFTGDDDQWKRFKDAVKNKIKWKMELPAPVPARDTT